MHPITDLLRHGLAELADPSAATAMRAYMKSALPFRGVAKPARTRLLRAALAEHPIRDAPELYAVARDLWSRAGYREERYLALSLVDRHATLPDQGWLPTFRDWIVEGAWWDFTDEIAGRRIGPLLRDHPTELAPVLRTWTIDPDRWLRRTSVICQLGAGHDIDLSLLTEAIEANLDDPDFFLRKGIGWALRQHSRTDAAWVRRFVADHPGLSALSRKEALRYVH